MGASVDLRRPAVPARARLALMKSRRSRCMSVVLRSSRLPAAGRLEIWMAFQVTRRISKARANAINEAHIDDLFVFDVALENIGAANDRARRRPGLAADHAVPAPQLVRKRAVARP